MSLAENLLKNMENDFVEYNQEDLEPHITIDESRIANVPQSLRTIAVTGDKDILTIPFDCARFIDGHDLSTFAIYLNYVLPDGTNGTYIPDSITTSDGDGEYHFDWLIKNNITKTNGKISFAITAIKTKQNDDGESVVDKQWSSIPNGDCSIALGLDISNVPTEEETPDVVSQLSAILERIHGDVDEWIKTVLVQTTGNNTAKAMSQKATTDGLEKILSDSKGYTDSRENELNKQHNSNLEKISKNQKMIANFDSSLIKVTDDYVLYSKTVPEGALLYAEVTKIGGMSYRDAEAGVLKNAKVTSIKSVVGKNLFNIADVTGCNDNNFGRIDGDTLIITRGLYAGGIYWLGTSMYLTVGTYTISADVYYGSNSGNDKAAYVGVIGNGYTFRESTQVQNDTWVKIFLTFNIVKDGFYNVTTQAAGNATQFTNLDFRAKNIQVERDNTATDPEAYKAATLHIPASVRAFDGYGLGITNSSDYNHIYFKPSGHIKTWNKLVRKKTLTGNEGFSLRSAVGKPCPCFVFTLASDKKENSSFEISPPFSHDWNSMILSGDYDGYGAMGNTNPEYRGVLYMCIPIDALGLTTTATEVELISAFKAWLKNRYDGGNPIEVVYRLAEPIITDISDLLTDDNFIEVHEGGVVIAENENGLDAPTTIVYRKEKLSPSDLEKLIKLIN